MLLKQAEVQHALQVLLSVSHNLHLERSTRFLALAVFADRTLSVLNKCKEVPVNGSPLWVFACACILNAAKLRPEGTTVTANIVFGALQKVLGARATCTCSDLCSADLWLASAVDVSGNIQLVSDILQDTLAGLRRTGMPAFIDQELPDLCDTILEALHSNTTFQGCLTRGGSLAAVSIICAAVLLSGKPEAGTLPGVLSMLSDFSGHPTQVILAQIKTVMTSVLS